MTSSAESIKKVLDFDRQSIWHPYTSIVNPLPVYPVESASGVRIRLMDGRELIDGMASWWSVIHGYSHPVLVDTIKTQAEKLSHVMFGGLTHMPAVKLAEKLIAITPQGLERVFFTDSGSVAVEVAMKMAIQYYVALGKREKSHFLTLRSGYHGDTFHCMSVCDPVTGMHHLFNKVLPEYYFADRPNCTFGSDWQPDDIDSFSLLLEKHHKELCAVILEPIVQGAGGMRFYHPQYLREVRKLCDKFDVLLIADEIATGLGRSGRLFGCEYAEISPDIMCLGKTLTGGTMTLAATLATKRIGTVISSSEPYCFMHGPTYMANPLACEVAAASINLLLESDWQRNIQRIEDHFNHELACCREMDHVTDVRVLGAIGVVEVNKPVEMAVIQKRFVERGIWVRPFGTLVYLMPPYCIDDNDLQTLTDRFIEVIEQEGKV